MVETPTLEQIMQYVEEYAIENNLMMFRVTYTDKSWDELETGIRAFAVDTDYHTHLRVEGRNDG